MNPFFTLGGWRGVVGVLKGFCRLKMCFYVKDWLFPESFAFVYYCIQKCGFCVWDFSCEFNCRVMWIGLFDESFDICFAGVPQWKYIGNITLPSLRTQIYFRLSLVSAENCEVKFGELTRTVATSKLSSWGNDPFSSAKTYVPERPRSQRVWTLWMLKSATRAWLMVTFFVATVRLYLSVVHFGGSVRLHTTKLC